MTRESWERVSEGHRRASLRLVGASRGQAEELRGLGWKELPRWARRKLGRFQHVEFVKDLEKI